MQRLACNIVDKAVSRSVAVIGAGAAGLVAARELLREGHSVTVFESQPNLGGVWAYNDAVDSDLLGRDSLRIRAQSSMYRDLRTNLPREIMGFSDFPCDPHFLGPYSKDSRRFCSHEEILSFLEAFADHHDLRPVVRFNTSVMRVMPLPSFAASALDPAAVESDRQEATLVRDSPRWAVLHGPTPGQDGPDSTADADVAMQGADLQEEDFDAVVVCNGHFSEPNLPEVLGMDTFPGLQVHSHNYRTTVPFRNKVVLVVGASFSGEDISQQVSLVADQVYLSARTWPVMDLDSEHQPHGPKKNIWRCPMLESLSADGRVRFQDGGVGPRVDSVIYCTGYKYTFPFLDHMDMLRSQDNHVYPLYLHMLPPSMAPSLSFVGLCWRVAVFPQFELQSKLIARLLSGRCSLPTRIHMQQAVDSYFGALEADGVPVSEAHAHNMWAYNDLLAKICGRGVDKPPRWLETLYKTTVKNKEAFPDSFKDAAYDAPLLEAVQRDLRLAAFRFGGAIRAKKLPA